MKCIDKRTFAYNIYTETKAISLVSVVSVIYSALPGWWVLRLWDGLCVEPVPGYDLSQKNAHF